MSSLGNELVTMFEDAAMTPEAIAADLGYDVVAVKAALMQQSRVYRNIVHEQEQDRAPKGLDKLVHEGEVEEMMEVIKDLGRNAESEFVRLKAAERIIDESQGRLDPTKEIRSSTVNLIQFNQMLLANRKAKEKVLEVKEAIAV